MLKVGTDSLTEISGLVAEAHVGADAATDPIFPVLRWLAQHFSRPYAEHAVAAGLPRPEERALPHALLPRAAARLGLKAKLATLRVSRIPRALLPSVVLLEHGQVCILVGFSANGRTARVVFPSVSDQPRSVRTTDLERDATGQVYFVAPDDAAIVTPDSVPQQRGHWFWRPVLRFWPAWCQIFCSALLINLLGLAFPLFTMNVYDRVIPNSAISTLWALMVGVLMALLFELLLRQLRSLVLDRVGRSIDLKIGSRLFRQAMSIRMKERQESIGTVASQIREFDSVREFFTSSSVIALTDLLCIGLGIGLLWMIAGPIALLALLAVPAVLVLTLLIQIPLARAARMTQANLARRHSILIETLGGIEAIKALTAEGVMQRRWEQALAASTRAGSSMRFWSSLALYSTVTIQQLVGIAIVGWGVLLVADGSITMGALIAASFIALRILAPLGSIAQTLARTHQSIAAIRSLNAFMAKPSDSADVVTSAQSVERGAIAFRSVTFAYANSQSDAVRDVSFAIAPGERVGFIGRIGSGKSTLGRLMAGLHSPCKGAILIDDIEISRYEPAELRAGVGFVAQETDLFDGTLRDNLLIGTRNVSAADLAAACHATGITEFAAANPAGLMLQVGERGRALSGGQRQAVVLARMLLRRPKLLFLDEPTSAMDMGSEADLVGRLRDWLQPDQTVIICTHRVSLLELVDRLIVLDQGRIVADGPKATVLRQLRIAGGAQPLATAGRVTG